MFDFLRRTVRPTPDRKFVFVPKLEGFEERMNPVVVANPETYAVNKASVLSVGVSNGILANDFDTADSGAVLNAVLRAGATYTGANSPPLPLTALTLNPNGSFTFVAPSDFNPQFGNVTFSYIARNVDTGQISNQATVTISITGAVGGTKFFATGSGPGIASSVRVFDSATGNEVYAFSPYEPSFLGGVRVATGDLNRDGVDDIVCSPGLGGGGRIKVFDGRFGSVLADFNPFEPSFRGGADAAIGNIDGLNGNDLIVGAGEGGGPRVQVFSGKFIQDLTQPNPLLPSIGSTAPILNFFAYEESFRNGVRVTAGDLENTRADTTFPRDFIVTGAGAGGGPVVKVFDGVQVANALSAGVQIPAARRSFFAFDPATRGGVTVAVGQFRGKGMGDIVAGNGTGTPMVRVFDGRTTAQLREFTLQTAEAPSGGNTNTGLSSSSLFGSPNAGGGLSSLLSTSGGGNTQGGARVATTDRNADGRSDIVAGAGVGNIARVRVYDGNSLAEINNFLAYDTTFLGGVFVGGNSLP